MRKQRILAATISAATALALALTGCSAAGTGATGGDGKLKVVASTTQVQDFVRQIAGDKVELTGLLKPGSSAHSFDPSPADLVALQQADLLIENGAGLDSFLDSTVESSGFKGKRVAAADGVDLEKAAEITAADHAAQAADGSADGATDTSSTDTAADADHDHDHGDADHDHGDSSVNPHIWTSLKFAKQMLQPIVTALSAADPENRDYYEQNAAAYGAKLDTLDQWITAEFAKVDPAKKKFVSSHNALLYYLADYDIQFVGSVIPSFEDNSEPSAAEINRLVENIKKSGVPAIFFESSVSDRLSTTVAKESDVVLVTDPIYADSLGVKAPADTYLGATIANTENILRAWGYTPSAVPAEVTAEGAAESTSK